MIQYSVIIPAYNAAATIAACLASLGEQKLPPAAYEIIVVDDGSTDATPQLVRNFSRVRYYRQENQGPAQARNQGVKLALGKIVLFIDADCQALPDWLETMVKPFADSNIAGVKGAYLTKQKQWVAQFVQQEYAVKYEKMKKTRFIDFIDTYSAAFRKAIFVQAGGYDTIFPTASVEDQEFSFRLAELGCKMVFVEQARVYHLHVATLKKYLKKKFKIAYWKVLVLKLHPRKILNDSHTPQSLKIEILLVYLALLCLATGIGLGSGLSFYFGLVLLLIFIGLAGLEMRPAVKPGLRLAFAVFMLFARSLALGSGLLGGMLAIKSNLKIAANKKLPTDA